MFDRNPRLWALVAVGVVLSVFGLTVRGDTVSLANAALSLAIIWVGIFPGIIYLTRPLEDGVAFPLMALSGVYYAVFFGFSGFLSHLLVPLDSWRRVMDFETGKTLPHLLMAPDSGKIQFYEYVFIDRVLIEAQLAVLLGMVCLFSVWYFAKVRLFTFIPAFRLQRGPTTEFDRPALLALIWALSALNIAYLLFSEFQAISSIGQFLLPAGYVAFGVFYMLYLRAQLPRVHAAVYFFVVLPLWCWLSVKGGALTPMLLLVVLWAGMMLMVKKTLPWKSLTAIGLLFLMTYPFLNLYRAAFWDTEYQHEFWESRPERTTQDRFEFLSFMITEDLAKIRIRGNEKLLYGLVRRISLILPLSHVVDNTPDPVPYWGGETYQTVLTGWVPRLIWKDKPEERWGNEFGRRYGILDATQRIMSVNIPWITEMFANFGWLGVVFGMAALGLFLGFWDHILNAGGGGVLEQAVGSAILLPLFYQESNFTLMTGSLLPVVISIWLYFYMGSVGSKVLGRVLAFQKR